MWQGKASPASAKLLGARQRLEDAAMNLSRFRAHSSGSSIVEGCTCDVGGTFGASEAIPYASLISVDLFGSLFGKILKDMWRLLRKRGGQSWGAFLPGRLRGQGHRVR